MACIARWMAASIRNSIILHCSFICGSSICISHFNKERRIRWRIQIWFDLSQVATLNYFLQMNLISFIWGYTQFWSNRHKKANAQNINPSSSTIFAGHKNDLQKSLFFLAMQEWAWLQDGHIIWLVLRDEIDLWHLQKKSCLLGSWCHDIVDAQRWKCHRESQRIMYHHQHFGVVDVLWVWVLTIAVLFRRKCETDPPSR